jgi:hypothetical protein
MEELRLQLVDLVGQLSLLAWDSKQHEPDERSQPRDTEGRHGLEAALAAMRPAPIAATLDDSALPGIKQYYNIVFSLIHSQLFVNGSDDNTLSGVISFSQQEAEQEMSPQGRWSKHVPREATPGRYFYLFYTNIIIYGYCQIPS